MSHPFFVLCHRFPGNELVMGECKSLTGGKMEKDGFALCHDIHLIQRAAFLQMGAVLLAHAETLGDLLNRISKLDFDATDFCIENIRLPGARKDESMSQARIAVADQLAFYPNLDHPIHHLVLVLRKEGWWFGEKKIGPDMRWKIHDLKPYRTSSSLSARLALALVNLAAVKRTELVLNPCCGTGSLMLEAASIGANVLGSDWNKRMVGMTNRNLAYFNYPFKAVWADARNWESRGDVLLVDLPYNRALTLSQVNTTEIIAHAITLAPRAVFIAGQNLEETLHSTGWEIGGCYRVASSSGFSRFIYQVNKPGIDSSL